LTKRDAGRMESADLYPHITAQIGPKWRVIECRDGEQWVLQHRSNKWHAAGADPGAAQTFNDAVAISEIWNSAPKIEIPLSGRCFERWV
jgi:hypothetical protein